MKNWIGFMQTSIGDKRQIEQLGKWMAALLTGAPMKQLLHLAGPGPSGKSVLAQLLVCMVGEEKVLRVLPPLQDPIISANLQGKRLIVLEELETFLRPQPDVEEPDESRSATASDLIYLLSGGEVYVREKFEKGGMIKPNLAFVATSNYALRERNESLWSRMLQIDMKVPSSRHPALCYLLRREIEDIKAWAQAL